MFTFDPWNSKMAIEVRNLKTGDILPHTLALLEGDISRMEDSQTAELMAENGHPECRERPVSWPIRNNRFKAIVPLYVGENPIRLRTNCGHSTSVILFHRPPTDNDHTVRLLYLVCADDEYDGCFQGPDPVCQNTAEVAFGKIVMAAMLIQLFVAESLHRHGLERRTFRLETDSATGRASCRTFRLSRVSTRRASGMSERELWNAVRDELADDVTPADKDRCKFVAFASFTRYVNPEQMLPVTHRDMVALTAGHAALGGGGLALLGTGCLHTWASTLVELVPKLTDCTRIDRKKLLDDSGYRGTHWSCYATTLGAMCHELGHTFGLCHSDAGMMGGDFGEIHRAFVLPELLDDLDPGDTIPGSTGTSPRASIPMGEIYGNGPMECRSPESAAENGVSTVSLATRIKLRRHLFDDWEAADWRRPEAIWLFYHKWLNAPSPENTGQGPRLYGSEIRARHRLRIVMIATPEPGKGTMTVCRHYEFTNGLGKLTFRLSGEDLWPEVAGLEAFTIMAEDSYGNSLISTISPDLFGANRTRVEMLQN